MTSRVGCQVESERERGGGGGGGNVFYSLKVCNMRDS